MGTRAWYAVRYKNKYYRQWVKGEGYPSGLGRELAGEIPRNATRREERKKAQQLKFHEELANASVDDDDYDDDESPDVVDNTTWITGQYDGADYTYIIDLDYRAFSVNGEVHFKLDNMPRNPSFYHYFEEASDEEANDEEANDEEASDRIHLIPEEHLTTVSYWPNPTFNVQEVPSAYDQMKPLIVDFEGWGAPSWDSLTVSQSLSVELVKTIVSDHKKTLAMADLMSEFGKVLLITWKVACAAAPSHLLCPAAVTPLSEEARYATTEYTNWSTRPDVLPYQITMHMHQFLRPYCWFRGCLVKFCLRLDEDAWLKLEIIQMFEHLRKNGRVSGVGILISSFQLVAVAVDDSEVRHSPVMDFHNGEGDVRAGLLLLAHLLSPAATVHNIPWRAAPTVLCSASSTLPEEVIQNVLRFVDDDTYHFVLPLVSRLVRSMCLAHPRIGSFILTRVNSDRTYQVLSTQESGTEIRLRLVRKGEKIEPGFPHVFQHHQVGVGAHSKSFEKRVKAIRKQRPHQTVGMSWSTLMGGKNVPTVRVPVVAGVWGMVGVGDEVTETA